MVSIVEQNSDEKGVIWPLNIAPYKIGIVLINGKDEKQSKAAENLYNELNKLGIDTLLDDRDERPGVKFNDIDLIGIPIRITIGKKLEDDLVELKLRKEETSSEYKIDDIIKVIRKICCLDM